MLRRDAGKSVSICDGFRKRNFFHLGRGFLPLLALMLLTTPQLAFAQDSLAVTVDPMSLTVQEEDRAPYYGQTGYQAVGRCGDHGGRRNGRRDCGRIADDLHAGRLR